MIYVWPICCITFRRLYSCALNASASTSEFHPCMLVLEYQIIACALSYTFDLQANSFDANILGNLKCRRVFESINMLSCHINSFCLQVNLWKCVTCLHSLSIQICEFDRYPSNMHICTRILLYQRDHHIFNPYTYLNVSCSKLKFKSIFSEKAYIMHVPPLHSIFLTSFNRMSEH